MRGLEQRFVLCPVDVKDAYLVYVVLQFARRNPNSSILVFAHTCREAAALALMFKVPCTILSSLSSYSYDGAGAGLADGEPPLLHLPGRAPRLPRQLQVQQGQAPHRHRRRRPRPRHPLRRPRLPPLHTPRHPEEASFFEVVNHNVPRLPKEYVHRVGRAARAGREGWGCLSAHKDRCDRVVLVRRGDNVRDAVRRRPRPGRGEADREAAAGAQGPLLPPPSLGQSGGSSR